MIFRYNCTDASADWPWYMIEVSTKNLRVVLRHIRDGIRDHFGSDSAEIFVCRELADVGLIFARSNKAEKVRRLNRIRGVQLSGNQFMSVDDKYVQGLITRAQIEHRARISSIAVGSFVRILDGPRFGYCGTVESLGRRATVKVRLFTRTIVVRTPVGNLQLRPTANSFY